MEVFANTADLGQLAHYRALGLISGVTTNPAICAAGAVSANPVDLIQKVVEVMGTGHVFVQVISCDPETQLEEARFLSGSGPRIVVKVPMDRVGMQSIPRMVEAGLQVSATAVNTIGRAIAAGQCGAHYAIPYFGWLEDSLEAPTGLVEDMAEIYRAQGYATRLHVLCRRVADLRIAARVGAWGVLLDPPDLERFFHHAQTEVAVKRQADAWAGHYGNVDWLHFRDGVAPYAGASAAAHPQATS